MTDREKMTSRERILASIRHREPDRVPVDLGGTPSSGISAIAYSNLKAYLDIAEGHTRVYDVVQQLAQPEDMLLDRFGVDVLDIGRAFNTEENDWYDITLPQRVPVQFPAWFHPVQQPDGPWDAFAPDGVRIATMPVGATFFDQTYFPYGDGYPADYADLPQEMPKIHWAGLVHSPWDHAGEPDFWQQLRQKALALRDSSDRALMIVAGCNLFEWGTFLRRIDNFLMDLVLNPDEVEKLLDALMEQHLATLEKVCEAVGDVADILRFGDDLGMDTGPFMAPRIYRKLFKPRHTILCEYVHTHSQMHTFLHSCGSIYRLLPDLIEAGYDIINPVQIGTRDMEPARLKREFGRDITFWGGGCDTRHVLNRGTPEKVKDHVKGLLEIWMPGGGFVFNTVHNILPDVPPKNIVAMFEAISEFNGV
ncbi:MAG TPA: uroporphyrinogen decarboxylase family protein [Anaerolineae bacterium]|nr:uroporphyrinogen decarboxylase family protein [Anaerolineae bacterium]